MTIEVVQTAGREPRCMTTTTLLWPRVLNRIFDVSRGEDVGARLSSVHPARGVSGGDSSAGFFL